MAIPDDFVNYKSTNVFSKDNVPKMFLYEHNTKAGVYGKIKVLNGSLKFTGFSERRGNEENEAVIPAGESLISPPEYWHKVELMTDDTQFIVEFYAQRDSEIAVKNLSERNEP